MIHRMPFPMRDAPLIQLRFICNGDPARYTVELTGTGWVRALRIVQRAAQQNGQAAPPAAGASAAPRALDAEQYARLRAVEIASPVAAQYAQSAGEYLQMLSALANWIALYITEGDPLESV